MIRYARALSILCAILACADGMCGRDPYEAAKARLDSLRSDPVEGVWQMNPVGGAALFSLCSAPGRPGVFDMRLLEAPDWRIPAGTLCGEVRATGRPGVYDCSMTADPGADGPPAYGRFTATLELADEGRRIVFRPYSNRRRISLRRWIPYFFRIVVLEGDTRPSGLEGATRVYPPAQGATPVNL